MNRALGIRIACYASAGILVVVGLYCLLWVFSSSSLVCTACNCTYSLFAENARCRQPPLAGLLCVASFVMAAALAFIGGRFRA